ncbi:hypothetical protein OE88DRAFT_1344788 [Heliocybe sulcata]|uniref:Uncharacterized protein n=1 Tax=Heliocybe sulcata TaxID=5364 RepID=A0A5C3N9J9_9AGAM|nr:hypothetical protein OE88DRAFT_1344788 [Heliocybe sulcata]
MFTRVSYIFTVFLRCMLRDCPSGNRRSRTSALSLYRLLDYFFTIACTRLGGSKFQAGFSGAAGSPPLAASLLSRACCRDFPSPSSRCATICLLNHPLVYSML